MLRELHNLQYQQKRSKDHRINSLLEKHLFEVNRIERKDRTKKTMEGEKEYVPFIEIEMIFFPSLWSLFELALFPIFQSSFRFRTFLN